MGNKYFFTKWWHFQTYQNYEQSRQKLGTFLVNKVLKKSFFPKNFINISWSPNPIFFTEIFFWKDSTNFRHWKMTLKLRILRSLTRLFIILVSLTRSLFSENMLISNRCISGLMPNLIKKSWTVSNIDILLEFLTASLLLRAKSIQYTYKFVYLYSEFRLSRIRK